MAWHNRLRCFRKQLKTVSTAGRSYGQQNRGSRSDVSDRTASMTLLKHVRGLLLNWVLPILIVEVQNWLPARHLGISL